MVRYRVIYIVEEDSFGFKYNDARIIESDSQLSRSEIARLLNIDKDNIIKIDLL